MANIGTGCLVVGDQVNQVPLIIPNAQTAFINHNAGKPYLYIIMTDAAQGQPIDNSDGLILLNDVNQTRITNTSGGTVGLYAYLYFEIFSPQQSGFLPASDVPVTP